MTKKNSLNQFYKSTMAWNFSKHIFILKLVFVSLYVLLNVPLISQPAKLVEENSNAEYLGESLQMDLAHARALIPPGSMSIRHKLEGDLVISIRIREDGFMDSLEIIDAQAKFIGEALLNGFNSLEQPCWKPAMQNRNPISKSYLIVFRHRMDPDKKDEFLSEASKRIQEGKLKKAAKIYSKAIKKWPYYSKLYQIRSMVYEKMGKTEAAKKDILKYEELKSIILQEYYISLNVFMH